VAPLAEIGEPSRMTSLLAALLLQTAPPPPAPPRALACLARYYALTPVQADGAWFGQLPDGTRVPWNDGRTKTALERFEGPDLHDVLLEPYPRGAIAPITTVDADPGRMRVDQLFFATYGASAAEVGRALVPLEFLGQHLRVHPRVKPAFQKVAARLQKLLAADPRLGPFLEHVGGTFNWRVIAGSDKLSAHSFGVSLDINVARSAYWQWQKPPEPLRWRNQIPAAIVEAFEAEGFIWGGRWYHYDTMHFEYRPELLDPDCKLE
jgi:hypothetical protein